MSTANGRSVVVHVAISDEAPIRNITNLMADPAMADAQVEVVLQGPGLDLGLRTFARADDIAELITAGVRVNACANSMTGRGVVAEELAEGVGIVSSAVGRLAQLQWDGAAYLRL